MATTVVIPEIITKIAIEYALDAQKMAHTGVSGVKIGACVIASKIKNPTIDDFHLFPGNNIEIASSRGYHAESVALVKAISDGYPYIHACVVTGSDDGHRAAMCGYCMQDFLYCAPDCDIIVAKPDGSIKLQVSLKERNGEYGYYGKGRLQI